MMAAISKKALIVYVQHNIGEFHANRLKSLETLKFDLVLKRKNPYLFKAKNLISAPELVKAFLDAYLSSQEEAIFGTFLEGLARFVCGKIYGGQKSAAEGIDLECDKDGVKYIISIKSGPNWGNSGQIKKMADNFRKAKKILGTNRSGQNVVAVNGCCYGRDDSPDKGDYLKLCGQRFWEFISGDPRFYLSIVEPIGHEAKEKNDAFLEAYAKVITKFTGQFIATYCVRNAIVWERVIKANAGANVKAKKQA